MLEVEGVKEEIGRVVKGKLWKNNSTRNPIDPPLCKDKGLLSTV